MFGYTDDAKNSMLADLIAKTEPSDVITHLSLHSTDPGTTGADEWPITRIAVTEANFKTPSLGSTALNSSHTFSNISTVGAVTFFGTFTDVSAGTFMGGGAITGDQAANVDGDYVLEVGTKLDLNL